MKPRHILQTIALALPIFIGFCIFGWVPIIKGVTGAAIGTVLTVTAIRYFDL